MAFSKDSTLLLGRVLAVELPEEDDEQTDEVDENVGDEDDAVCDAGDDAPLPHVLVLLLHLGLLVADLLQDVPDGADLLHQRGGPGTGELLHHLLESSSSSSSSASSSSSVPCLRHSQPSAMSAEGRGRGWRSGTSLFRAVVEEADLGEVDVGVGVLALGVAADPPRVPAFVRGGGVVGVGDLAAEAQHASEAVDHHLQHHDTHNDNRSSSATPRHTP